MLQILSRLILVGIILNALPCRAGPAFDSPEMMGLLSKIPPGTLAAGMGEWESATHSSGLEHFVNFSSNAAMAPVVMPTFGLSHIIQGRYWQRGWMFTLAESASVALFAYSANTGCTGEAGGGCLIGAAAIVGAGALETTDLLFAVIKSRKRSKIMSKFSASVVPGFHHDGTIKLTYQF